MGEPADATVTDARIASPSLAGGDGALAPGHLLAGRYRIERFIARGGIGEVYEAGDALLGERVAVKLLRPEVSRKPGAQERFADEIRLARRITHPNVCRVFDVGADGDRVFFTMELHPGETLGQRIRREGAMGRDAIRPVTRQLLAGIAAAHEAGVIHTDLKPSNVLIGEARPGAASRVVVTDFGLAVPCCAMPACACAAPHLVGTPAYMAPEQVTGDPLVERTDLFSFGVILFELLTGTLPWTGATAHEVAHARLSGPRPSPRERRPDVDPAWDAVVTACLAVSPADRPCSAAEIAAALRL